MGNSNWQLSLLLFPFLCQVAPHLSDWFW
uniref:Uncharacterized protein n=1 Tax=Arundo donax TaxID=35708 RepID=A0A0A9C733_ARUDO